MSQISENKPEGSLKLTIKNAFRKRGHPSTSDTESPNKQTVKKSMSLSQINEEARKMLDMDDDISELGESSEDEKTVKEVETSSPQKKGKKKTKASKKMIPTEMQEALDKCLTDMLPMITKTIKQAVTASLSERFGQLEEKLEQKLCVIDSQMSHIVEKQNMIEQEMSDVKTHLSSQAETIAEQANRLDKMEKLVKASKENVIESVEEKISIKLSDTTESSLKEIELREAKRLNVMFFNVKESSSENDEVRVKKGYGIA